MRRALLLVLPLIFTAQACNFLFGDITGSQGSGNRGIFLSTDGGQTWGESSKISKDKSLAGAQVYKVFIESRNPKNLLAATLNSGLFASDSAGDVWAQLLPAFAAYDTFINPYNPEEIYVAGSKNKLATVLKSTNRGGSWTEIYAEPKGQAAATTIAYDSNNPSVLYVGLTTGTILRSIDAGKTWKILTDFKDRIIRIRILGGSLYAMGRSGGLRRSQDTGKTWTELKLAEQISQFNEFTVAAQNFSELLVGTDKGLFETTDSGATWNKLLLPATPDVVNVSAVSLNPQNSRQIFAAISSTVYRSDDGGASWHTANLTTKRIISDIAIDPREPNRIYVGLK